MHQKHTRPTGKGLDNVGTAGRAAHRKGRTSSQRKAATPPQRSSISKKHHMQILRDFDLNPTYGPCVGISRAERWERAHSFDLSPPKTVKNLLDTFPEDKDYQKP